MNPEGHSLKKEPAAVFKFEGLLSDLLRLCFSFVLPAEMECI